MKTFENFLGTLFRIAFIGFLVLSCGVTPRESEEVEEDPVPLFASGDLIVANGSSDSVVVLDSDGNFKAVLANYINYIDTPTALAFNQSTGEVFIAVDGTPDRVVAVNDMGEERVLVNDPNLTSTGATTPLRGLMILPESKDLLIVESQANTIERFQQSGGRVTAGGWPKTLASQGAGSGLNPTAAGGFVHCSTTGDIVGVYDKDGTLIGSTAASGIAATTDGVDCIELANGTIAVTWSGTNDAVQIRSANLSSEVARYQNASFLTAPTGLVQLSGGGNILALESALNFIIELDTNLNFVRILGDEVLSNPQRIIVIP